MWRMLVIGHSKEEATLSSVEWLMRYEIHGSASVGVVVVLICIGCLFYIFLCWLTDWLGCKQEWWPTIIARVILCNIDWQENSSSEIHTSNSRLTHVECSSLPNRYSSLSDITNHMFPAVGQMEALSEYSSLQYWRTPMPDVTIEIEALLALERCK